MRNRRFLALLAPLMFSCSAAPPSPAVAASGTIPAPSANATPIAVPSLDTLTQGSELQGFVAEAVYVDDANRARGARFVHSRTHFVFDYLQIESAPQTMIYATTYPTSDKGEPHTQEHLLLGKGNKGRYLGNFEHVMLAESNAFTEQYRTAYDFFTMGGTGAFWPMLKTQIDALLRPDYTDDEIRREVRDYGIAKLPNGDVELAEKGTVYNEMVRSSEMPDRVLWSAMNKLVYGDSHPLALDSGGTPEGIRNLTPAEIRAFHAAHYQLANMGMAAAFSASIPLSTVLAEVGAILDSFPVPSDAPKRFMTAADLPAPKGGAVGTARVVEYPYATSEHSSPALLMWPATRRLDLPERVTLEAFLGAFGNGEGSSLHKVLVDQKTRSLDVGATGVSAGVSPDLGQPVFVGVNDVSAAHTNEASLLAIRALVRKELAAIAALPDGSKELAEFGERVRARLIEQRRGIDKFLDTPPQFGKREIEDDWLRHLDDVNLATTFRRSLTKKDALDHAFAVAAETKNPWRGRIASWGLLEEPYAIMTQASPKERARLDDERAARTKAELARLVALYGVSSPKEALIKRGAEIDKISADLAKAEADVVMPPFWSSPPMTDDDGLAFRTETVRGVPIVASTFDTMKSVTVGLALRLDALPEDALPLVAMLPALMGDVGIVRDGVAISYEDVQDRLRREVLDVSIGFDASFTKDRAELMITASGNDLEEAKRALGWARDFLVNADLRPENLEHIRDVVTQSSAALDNVMTTSEEGWATRIGQTYRKQASPTLLHTQSFLTRAYDVHRLWWMLSGGRDAASTKRVTEFLRTLSTAGKVRDRAALVQLSAALASGEPSSSTGKTSAKGGASKLVAKYLAAARALRPEDGEFVKKAGADLGALMGGVPDSSLATDWESICLTMARDFGRSPTDTLAAVKHAVASIRHAPNARAWMVGSSHNQTELAGDLDKLVAALDPSPAARATYATTPRILDRARARGVAVSPNATFGLVNPNNGSCAIVNYADGVNLDSTGAALVDMLAANVFAGGGTQSLFKRIWASGLAYNGGIRVNALDGKISYYSDRIADAPELVRLLSRSVRETPADSRFVDYAIANEFNSRVGLTYETRAEAMATDLTDGWLPARIRAFRERLLALRGTPHLIDDMHSRFVPVLSALLPPLAGTAPLPAGALHMIIGPEKHLSAYERELAAEGGKSATLVRLYPRDFWYTADVAH